MEERFKELENPIIPIENPEPATSKVPSRLKDKIKDTVWFLYLVLTELIWSGLAVSLSKWEGTKEHDERRNWFSTWQAW